MCKIGGQLLDINDAPNMDLNYIFVHGYALTWPFKCRRTGEPNFTMSSVGIRLINFEKQSSINVSHCQILLKMLCFVLKMFVLSFPQVLIAVIPIIN